MKILYLTKYTRMAGSSRMRSYQYFPYLEAAGMQAVVKPFFDEAYLKDFYAGKKNISAVLKSYLRRFFLLFSVWKYDKVVIEKEIFPFLPAFAEWILKASGVKYIVDYDDAIFHNYDQSSNPVIKKFLRNKIAQVMRYSEIVVAGNGYLAEYASRSGAEKIQIIPTVIDLDRYPLKQKSDFEKFVVGWIGTKTTFEKHLLPCKEWIKELQNQDSDIHFHIVGITEDMDLGENVKYIQWTENTEVPEILKMDVGIMPLQDSEWEKGKCAYKLIQYAACGIPGVASDVGMNKEVCIDNETGFIAKLKDEWIEKILFLKNNSQMRNEMGHAARKLVEDKYCIQVTAESWGEVIIKQ
ncbi:glycosyltransferase family 4 protein [Chryseobacterium sp. KACC 21268]|nr:glycosyltransferase family 4 protein [Chryseobacterium sp. KACC 21268]